MTRSRLALALVAMLVAAITAWATAPFGPGASPDAASYVATARSLLEGRGFTTFGPHPYTAWPPLIPLELALIGLAGVDPLDGLRWTNIVASGAVVWIAGRIALEEIGNRVLAWLAIAALAALPASRIVGVFAWSEPMFTLFLLLAARALPRGATSDRRRELVLAAVFAALACLTRYIGVAIVIAGAWSILATRQRRRRWSDAAVYVALALSPLLAWIARNASVDAHPLGDRFAAASTPIDVARKFAEALHEGLIGAGTLSSGLAATCGVVAAALIVFSAWRSRADAIGAGLRASAAYLALVSVLCCVTGFDGWTVRIVAPIAPFLALGVAKALDLAITTRSHVGVGLALIVLAWVVAAGSASIAVLERARAGRLPYQARAHASLEIVRWSREHALEGLVFANDPAALALFARRDAYITPSLLDAPGNAQARAAIELAPSNAPRWLVWIGEPASAALEHELSRATRRDAVEQFADGAVFRMR